MKLNNFQIFLCFVYSAMLGSVIYGAGFVSQGEARVPLEATAKAPISTEALPIKGIAGIIYDIREQRIIYSKNDELQLPTASLSKIMTALVGSELPEESITVAERDLSREGDTGLSAGELWNTANLIDFTLIGSSNDGAAAIANAFTRSTTTSFVDLMNRQAADLGLAQTYFLNETGLDIAPQSAGGYTSARDIALLMAHLVTHRPEIIEKTKLSSLTTTSLSGTRHTISNTNKSLDAIPGIIASKTGFTDLAGGNLAIAFDVGPARPMVAVILGSTLADRENDIRTLVDAAIGYVTETIDLNATPTEEPGILNTQSHDN